MDLTLLISYTLTTLLFVATPGPSVAYVTAQALKHGAKGAYVSTAGDALGTVVHIAVAASSLSVLIALADFILPPLQIAGGVYLLYLAYRSFFTASKDVPTNVNIPAKATFWTGFFTCVSNPKAIVFFVALFPAFISPEHSVLMQSLVYGLVFLILDAVSILAYALLAMHTVNRVSSRWLRPDILSGLGLSGVGLAMIFKGYRSVANH